MLVSQHVALSLLLSVVLFPVFKWYVIFIWLAGFLMDADHYIFYALKYKRFNLIEAYHHFKRIHDEKDYKDIEKILLIFHTVEFILVLAILSLFSIVFFVMLIGVVFHLVLDFIYDYSQLKKRLRPNSLIKWFYRHGHTLKET